MELSVESVSKDSLLSFLENEANIRVDGFLESAIAVAKEVHEGVKREDGTSSFLNTHYYSKKTLNHFFTFFIPSLSSFAFGAAFSFLESVFSI